MVVGRGAAREQHEGFVAQPGERDLALAAPAGARPAGRRRRARTPAAGLQFGRHAARVDEADVEPVVQQLGHLLAGVEFGQRDAHRRMRRLEARQRLRQAAVEHGADEADAQPPGRALRDVAAPPARASSASRSSARAEAWSAWPAGVRRTALLLRSNSRAPTDSSSWRIGHAQRRLRDRQPPCGAAEVQLLGQHDEVAQVAKLHGESFQQ